MDTPTKALTSAPATHVRRFDPRRDLAKVADLIELCFNESLDRDGRRYVQSMRSAAKVPGIARISSLIEDWSSIPLEGFIWEEEDNLVGNLTLIPFRLRQQKYYLIANVAVHPEFRRKGIARELTRQGIEYARLKGSPSVWLQVREENAGATALYQGLGFKEQARRSDWFCRTLFDEMVFPEEIQITRRPASLWPVQQAWLEQTYPTQLRWHLPLRENVLQPNLWGALQRIANGTIVDQWVAWKAGQPIGILACQTIHNLNCLLWLSVSPEEQDLAVQSLLYHAHRVRTMQSLVLEYPAHQADEMILSAGFQLHQILIWMKIDF